MIYDLEVFNQEIDVDFLVNFMFYFLIFRLRAVEQFFLCFYIFEVDLFV